MQFPDNKRFALSFLDDTDDSTLANIRPVYQALIDNGFRTTKTVWPLDCPEGSRLFFAADTLQDKAYSAFVHQLSDLGFEIAFHGATMESSDRARTLHGLEFLRQEFGRYPRVFCNHGYNQENLYWGHKRVQTRVLRGIWWLLQGGPSNRFAGERRESRFFWGDICKRHISYVRNFTFRRLNLCEVNPEMPYALAETEYVNYWFSTADAHDATAFKALLTPERIDALERRRGVCIVSTHFGKGFVRNAELDPAVRQIFEYIGQKAGWLVPVSAILDHLLFNRQTPAELSWRRRAGLEFRFMVDQMLARMRCA